ncbi:MAG TPA: diguanylate cyclase, partial [Rhodospirillales bacterium]|nr:diguanylate cyclase [Rhodospirillales bacterium]
MKSDKINNNVIDKIDTALTANPTNPVTDDQELALFAAEKRRFIDITRLVSDWIWETDPKFVLSYVSLRVMDVLGFHPYSLKGRSLNSLGKFVQEDGEPSSLNWSKPFRDELFVIVDNDAQPRHFLMSGIPVFDPQSGQFMGVRGTAEDVTQRRRTEQLLHQSEFRYRTLYRKSPVMAYSTDKAGLVISASDHLLANLGYGEDEFIGQQACKFMTSGFVELFDAAENPTITHDGQSYDVDCQFRKKDGTIIDVLISTINDEDEHEGVVQTLNVVLDVTERKHYEAVLLRQANYDFLTGLPNRGLAMDRLSQAFGRAHRGQKSVALLFLDLDKFKKVNDTFGHAVGDQLLCEVGDRIHTCIRQCDTVARMGGDEFLVILPDLDSGTLSEVVARKILRAFEQPFILDRREMVVTTSIGMAIYPTDESEPEQLLRSADAAMYRAKAGGRNNFRFYAGDKIDLGYDDHLTMENCLRRALDRDEFFLEYQPVVDASDKKITGFETLLRWESPELGLVYPDQFIAMAEETGL